MNIFTCCLLALVGFFDFQCASGLPEDLQVNHVLVKMEDNSIWEGFINPGERHYEYRPIPNFMQPKEAVNSRENYFFIRTEWEAHFLGALDPAGPVPKRDPHRRPKYVEVHLGRGTYFVAEGFKVYDPENRHSKHTPNYPPKDCFYVGIQGGAAYIAPLREYNPATPSIGQTSTSHHSTS